MLLATTALSGLVTPRASTSSKKVSTVSRTFAGRSKRLRIANRVIRAVVFLAVRNPKSPMPSGFLALILHAHLPFVRHPEHEHFLEEDWFFEAITECYVPLVRMMQRLVDEHVPFKLAMSLTPTLCAMLKDKLLCERYVRPLDSLIDLATHERK